MRIFAFARLRECALTDRQAEVLRLLLWGMNNEQIGRELAISENTVKQHLQSVCGSRRRNGGCMRSISRQLRWAKVLVRIIALIGCLAPQMVSAQTRPFPVFSNNNFVNGGPGPNGTFFDPETPGNKYCTQVPNNPLVGWINGQAPFPLNGLTPVLPLCASGDQNPANGVRAEFRCTMTDSSGPDADFFCPGEHGVPNIEKCYDRCPTTANPTVIATGNKRQVEFDYRGSSLLEVAPRF